MVCNKKGKMRNSKCPIKVFRSVGLLFVLLSGWLLAASSYSTGLSFSIPVSIENQPSSDLTGNTILISIASDGSQGNDNSLGASISADGRFIAFEADASNLVPGDTNGYKDIFVRDRQAGLTERVSVASNGSQGNGISQGASISADGRYVAFESNANNLVAGDINGAYDVFVHDRQSGETELVSIASDGSQGNDTSRYASISVDDRFVVFESIADTLVPGGQNNWDVFIHDRQTGHIELVSVAYDGSRGDGYSMRPSFSADSRFIVFTSMATNLLPDAHSGWKIYVRDRQTGQTELISDGIPAGPDAPFISADGHYVAFGSDASDLVPGDTNGKWDIFVFDRQTRQIERVSVASEGSQGNGHSTGPSISGDGRFVSFYSFATNLVAGGTTGNFLNVFVHDRFTGKTELASVASDGTQGGNASSFQSVISPSGRFVAFTSGASNLVTNDSNSASDVDVFLRDRGYSISGKVIDANGDPLSGVAITLGTSQTVMPGSDGKFNFRVFEDGNYTITPSRQGYYFVPSYWSVILPPWVTPQDFTGYLLKKLFFPMVIYKHK